MFESTKLNAERQVQVASMLMHAADTQPALLGPVRATIAVPIECVHARP